jgi:hypothetical protein
MLVSFIQATAKHMAATTISKPAVRNVNEQQVASRGSTSIHRPDFKTLAKLMSPVATQIHEVQAVFARQAWTRLTPLQARLLAILSSTLTSIVLGLALALPVVNSNCLRLHHLLECIMASFILGLKSGRKGRLLSPRIK